MVFRFRAPARRPRRRFAALTLIPALLAALPLPAAAASEPDDLAAFLAVYRCPLRQRVNWIADPHTRRAHPNDRFVILVNDDIETNLNYVQCIVSPDDADTVCEASSGFYFTGPGEPRSLRMDPDKVRALVQLGFSPDDSKGNFVFRQKNAGAPDLSALTDFMLTALFKGYEARADSHLGFSSLEISPKHEAPLSPSDCPYVS